MFENLSRLAENPFIGKYDRFLKIYTIVISKQTTLYYSFNQKEKNIDLHVFWNNLKNPTDLTKLL